MKLLDKVRIVKGPYSGKEGTLMAIGENNRVSIILRDELSDGFLNGYYRVEVSILDVEDANALDLENLNLN